MPYQLNIDWSDFLKNYWQKKPVILRNAFPHFIDPITPDELAGLALEDEIDSRIVTNKQGKWDAQFGPFTDYAHLGEEHWSLLVQAVDHWHPEAAQLLKPFKVLPHWQFEDLMISFATPAAGVGPHIDNYDVFIIQGMGTRHWRVGDRNPNYKQFSAHKALLHVEAYQPIIDEHLTAGDILYIPIGFPHNGVSITNSLSYSVGFRSPTSQEMLSSFADYVLDNVPQGIFYQEPNLQLSEQPYAVLPNELAQLKSQLSTLINEGQLFNDWFGRHITEPMHELDIVVPEQVWTLDDLKQMLAQGSVLYRVPSIRIVKIADSAYIHKEKIDVPAQFIDMLCEQTELQPQTLQNDVLLSGLLPLINLGFWYFDE